MENETLNRVFTSVRHHNYEAAIFQLSFTSFEHRNLLLGILYYFNALSHIKNKEFKYAAECFDAILSNQTLADTDKLYKEFYITNDEYIYELHADCLTQLNEREKALGKYLEAVQISALPKSCKNLMMENRSFTLQNCFPFEKSFFEDLTMYKATKNAGILQKYHGKLEYCLFFQSEAAKYLFEDGNNLDSLNVFNIVKRMDNLYFNNVDVYSTILWYNKDVDSLGFLCRKLVDTTPKASITWLALGNYFSLEADHERSIQCFKRSIIIASNHYSLTLLGHEHIIKQDYTLAAKYFTQSLKKYRNNYNACFGLGVVYTTMNKIENAEYYLKKAIKSNQNNLRLKYYMMQFYNRIKDYTRAIEVLCDVFGCNLQSLDVTKILADCNVDENREIILLESIDFFLYNDQENTCQYILENVRYRGKTYYQKKKLLNKTGE